MTRRSPIVVASLLIIVLVAVLLSGCGGTTTTATQAESTTTSGSATTDTSAAPGEPIVIGCYTPLTGPLAGTGMQVATGVKFAVDEWNEKGGVNGRPIELLIEDDQSTPNGAVNAFNKLISSKPAFIIAPPFTGNVLSIEQALISQGKLPVFTGATAIAITKGGDGWFFRIRSSDELSPLILAKFALEELGATKPAVIYPNNDYGLGGYEIMKETFAEAGIEIVTAETFNQGQDKDVSAQINKVKQAGADVLLAWTVPVDSAMVTIQANQLGVEFPVIGGAGFGTPDYLQLVQEASEGIYALIDSSAGMDDFTKDWAAKVKEAYPESPVSFVVSTAYDATNMGLEAIANGAEGPEALRDALKAVKDYQGMTGIFTCDANNNMLHQGVIGQWRDMKYVPVKTITVEP